MYDKLHIHDSDFFMISGNSLSLALPYDAADHLNKDLGNFNYLKVERLVVKGLIRLYFFKKLIYQNPRVQLDRAQ